MAKFTSTPFSRQLKNKFEERQIPSGTMGGTTTVRGVEQKQLDSASRKFLDSGVSAEALARNPSLFPLIAEGLQFGINQDLRGRDTVRETSGSGAAVLPGTRFAFEFNLAQQQLQQDFINAEIDRQFGAQNITSQTSTVNAQGVRTPISGRQPSTTPTAAQRDAISLSFRSPLERQVLNLPAGFASPGQASSNQRLRSPTILSGAGQIRRRTLGRAPASTILTSDADDPIAASSLLG